MRSHRFRWASAGAALVAVLIVVAGSGLADTFPAQHGITLSKGCASPTSIGAPYTCAYTVFNTSDDAHDTLTIHSLVDVVHSAGGDVNSGNILGSVQIKTTTTANGTTPS